MRHVTTHLQYLKVNERIEYKLLSLTYKVLTTAQPSYLHNLISLQPPRSTRSSSVARSFRHASPRLWNQLPDSLRQPHHSCLDSPLHPFINLSSPCTLVIHHSFTPGSKPTFSTNPSHRRFLLPTGLPHDKGTVSDLSRSSFCF